MARTATGQVIPPNGSRQRSWAIRFRAYGERRFVTLGPPEEGWDRDRAQRELRHVLADVERGIWRPPEPDPVPEVRRDPTFHEFAADWLRAREPELAPKTVAKYRWALELHLLPVFAGRRLSELTRRDVDEYKAAKLREGRIAAAQVNTTLKVLSAILDLAVEYELLDGNVAEGKRRRVKVTKPQRSWVEPEQLPALLDAAGGLRPILAALAGAGLRVGEAVALDWRDVNLATGTLTVRESKTAAGTGRVVDLPLGLADELRVHKARSEQARPGDPVFVNRDGRRQTIRNVEARIKTAIRRANVRLAELGIEPISERVTPHSLRRTYASLRAVAGDSPVTIAEQIGHEDAGFTLRVYAKATKRRGRLDGEYLAEFDRALQWAGMGREADSGATLDPTAASASEPKSGHLQPQ
jgi:integrase